MMLKVETGWLRDVETEVRRGKEFSQSCRLLNASLKVCADIISSHTVKDKDIENEANRLCIALANHLCCYTLSSHVGSI